MSEPNAEEMQHRYDVVVMADMIRLSKENARAKSLLEEADRDIAQRTKLNLATDRELEKVIAREAALREALRKALSVAKSMPEEAYNRIMDGWEVLDLPRDLQTAYDGLEQDVTRILAKNDS